MKTDFSSFKDLLNYYEFCPVCRPKSKRINYYFHNFSQSSINNTQLAGIKASTNKNPDSPNSIIINYNTDMIEFLGDDNNKVNWKEKLYLICPKLHFTLCVSVADTGDNCIKFFIERISEIIGKSKHIRITNDYADNKFSALVNGYKVIDMNEAMDLSDYSQNNLVDLVESILIV